VLMNVDILTDMNLLDMIADHIGSGEGAVAGSGGAFAPLATLAVTDRSTSRYFLFDEQEELCGWRNVQTGQERIARMDGVRSVGALVQKAFSGIHVIDPDIFPLIRQSGKFSMVDVYLDLAAGHTIRGFDHSGSLFIDVGRPESAEKAAGLFP